MSMINEYRKYEKLLECEREAARRMRELGFEGEIPSLDECLRKFKNEIANKYINVKEVTSESVEVNPIGFDFYTAARLGGIALNIDPTLELNPKPYLYAEIKLPQYLEIIKKVKERSLTRFFV